LFLDFGGSADPNPKNYKPTLEHKILNPVRA